MRVLVVGAGYVGLTTATVLSTKHEVTIVELDDRKIEKINSGIPPFYEKDMDVILKESVSSGRLKATRPLSQYSHHDFVIIAVGTPPNSDGTVNLDYLRTAINNLKDTFSSILDEYLVIAIRSTIPPGTSTLELLQPLSSLFDPKSFGVVYNPEFMKQGFAIEDFVRPDRVVIGSSDSRAADHYIELIRSVIQRPDTKFLSMSMESAELCKYASNCFLATKVSFANEISSIAEKLENVDIDDVMDAVTADSRINPSHLRAGLGFGGTCLPKDLSGLISFGQSLGLPMQLLHSVDLVNKSTATRLINILNGLVQDISGKKVAVLGLTFKAGTDDTRSSQAIHLIQELVKEGVEVWAHDPMANDDTIPDTIKDKFLRGKNVRECTEGAVATFLMTDWPMYKDMGIQNVTSNMSNKLIIDGRRTFARSAIPPGVEYRCLGSYHE